MVEPLMTSFILEAYGHQRAAEQVAASEPFSVGKRVRSCEICDSVGALPSREAGSETARHVTAPETSPMKRRGQSHKTRNDTKVLLS
jgi:hypothetical protein